MTIHNDDNGSAISSDEIDRILLMKVKLNRLDFSTIHEFSTTFMSAIDSGREIVLDLTRVDYCDSAGFGALLSCRSVVKSQGGNLLLCGVAPKVERVFNLMRLNLLFPVFRNAETALKGARNGGPTVSSTTAIGIAPTHSRAVSVG